MSKGITVFFFKAATAALTSMESQVLKAAIYFLTITLDKSSELSPPLVDYFKTNGLALVRQILLAIGKSCNLKDL